MTKAEHLKWARARALALLDKGKLSQALASFSSDMMKHEGTCTKETMGLLNATFGLVVAGARTEDLRGAIDVIVYRLTGEWPDS